MPQATYITHDGEQFGVEIENGVNLMQAALDNNVSGILGDCGGGCACATCHVFVDDAWFERTGGPSELESDLLEGVLDLRETSRLSCQIAMSDELDGIVVHLPESQI